MEGGPDVEPALADLIAEWTTTRDDLGGVDADSAPDPSDWADVLAAADERIEIYQARRDAVLGGDRSAIEAAFRPDYEFPGADFTTNGLAERSCRGVSF